MPEYFRQYPENAEKVVLNVKGGRKNGGLTPDGSRENIRRSVEDCLAVLDGTKTIDVFECARQDPSTPIEDTVGSLAELVKEGKIGAIALCEVKAETIRRAAKVHKIATVEAELSLWATEVLKNGVAATCAELGIPLTAYSPIARGALTKKLTIDDIPEGDFRRRLPRYQPETLKSNNRLTDEVEKLAKRKGCTPAQVAVAWVRHLSGRTGLPIIIPIPGATLPEMVEENAKEVPLTNEDMAELGELVDKIQIMGERYGIHAMHLIEG